MSYRCDFCTAVVPPGTQRRTVHQFRDTPRGPQIEREYSACQSCYAGWEYGASIQDLLEEGAEARQQNVPHVVVNETRTVNIKEPTPAPERITL